MNKHIYYNQLINNQIVQIILFLIFCVFLADIVVSQEQSHQHSDVCLPIGYADYSEKIKSDIDGLQKNNQFLKEFLNRYQFEYSDFIEVNSYYIDFFKHEIVYETFDSKTKKVDLDLIKKYFELVDRFKKQDELLFEIPKNHGVDRYYFSKHIYNPIDKKDDGTPKTLQCLNAGFEDATWNGWGTICATATNGVAVVNRQNYNPDLTGCNSPAGSPRQHSLVTGGNDAIGGFSRVFQGGVSAMLGNGAQANNPQHQAAVLSKTFFVDPSNTLLIYNYAAVLFDGGHTPAQQPFFSVKLFVSGNSDPCAEYSATANDGQAGWINAGGNRYYRDWTTIAVPLDSYIGQNVTLEFTVSDCFVAAGGHWAYAYVDVSCDNFAEIEKVCEGSSTLLQAPSEGFQSYLWSTGETSPSIRVTTPGIYTVAVTPYGSNCAATLSINATIFPNPIADFTFNYPTICVGGDIEFTNTSTAQPGSIISGYQWGYSDGISTPIGMGAITGVSQTSGSYEGSNIHTFNTLGGHNIMLIASSTDGCTDTTMHTINVVTGPEATITGGTTVCENNSSPVVTFTGSLTSGPLTFTYNVNGGPDQFVTTASGSMSTTVPVPTSPAGTYTYNLTYVLDPSAPMCEQSQTGTVIVVVNPLPTATIGTAATVCEGDTAPIVTLTGANGTSNYSFTYSINSGTPQTATTSGTNSVTFTIPTTTAGVYDYVLTSVQDVVTGCSQAVTAPGNSALITINPTPTATITGSTVVCQNDAQPVITFTGSNSSGTYEFTYRLNNGAIQTVLVTSGTVATINVPTNVAGTFNYELLRVTDPVTGCFSLINQTQSVLVNPLPTATIGTATTVCEGDAAPIVTLTGANGTSNYSFTYSINSGTPQTATTSGTNSVTFTIPTTTAGVYDYVLTSVQDVVTGCSQAVTAPGNSALITINPTPTATITGSTVVCQNDAQPVITFTGSNSSGTYEFTYRLNNGAIQTVLVTSGTVATINVPTNVAGTFNYELLRVTDPVTGCFSLINQTQSVLVNPLPNATVGSTTAVCEGDASPIVTFTGTGGTSTYTFTYTLNSGAPQTVTTVGGTSSVTYTIPTATAGIYDYFLSTVQDVATGCIQTVGAPGNRAIITVNPTPDAVITGGVVVCRNDSQPVITFTGSNSTGSYSFLYRVNNGANQTITTTGGSNFVTINVPTNVVGSFIYELVRVTDPLTNCTQLVNETQVVVVNPIPTAVITGTTVLCQNDTAPRVRFRGLNGTSDYRFTYSINGGAPQTIQTSGADTVSIAVSTAVATTYTYNLISVVDVLTGCSQSQVGSAVLTINPTPTGTSSGTVSVCQNSPNQLITFTGNNSSGGYTFSYTINGGPVQIVNSSGGNSATVSQTATVPGTFIYELINVMDPLTMCNVSLSSIDSIVVRRLPSALISPPINGCYFDTLLPEVQFTGLNGDSPYLFTYNINGGPSQTVNSTGNSFVLQHSTNTIGTFIYSITHVQEGSILGCQQNQNLSTAVTIHALPIIDAGVDFSICQGQPVILSGNGAQTYTWDNGIVNGHSFTPSASGTTTYTVIGTDHNGCRNLDSITINVIPIPVMDIIGQNLYGCQPVTPIFTNNSTGNLANCTWYLGNGEIVNNCGTFSSVFPNVGCFDVTLEVETPEGCKNALTLKDYVCVEGMPVAQFTPTPEELSTYQWESQMVNESIGATNYSWNFGDGTAGSTLHSPTHAFPNDVAGNYLITLIASTNAGCSDTATAIINLKEELLFYVPNTFTPNADYKNEMFKPVFSTGFDTQGFEMLIFNRWGELIFETHNADIGWEGKYGIDGHDCQDGTYTWKIMLKRRSSNEKKEYVGHVNLLR